EREKREHLRMHGIWRHGDCQRRVALDRSRSPRAGFENGPYVVGATKQDDIGMAADAPWGAFSRSRGDLGWRTEVGVSIKYSLGWTATAPRSAVILPARGFCFGLSPLDQEPLAAFGRILQLGHGVLRHFTIDCV